MPLLLLEVRSLPKSVTVRFGGDFMNITTRPEYKQFTVVRDTGFEPVTPYRVNTPWHLEAESASVGDCISSHANPCRNGKCYSEMLHRFSYASGVTLTMQYLKQKSKTITRAFPPDWRACERES
jgi:hypothetical protein